MIGCNYPWKKNVLLARVFFKWLFLIKLKILLTEVLESTGINWYFIRYRSPWQSDASYV